MSEILGGFKSHISQIMGGVWENKTLLVAAGVGVAGVFWWRKSRPQQAPIYKPPENWQKDVVYLYTFPRRYTKQVVNLSPFAMKLETWLRMHKIKYEVTETIRFSPNRKQIPYIWFNGELLEDSGLIIKLLTSHFKLDESEALTEEQRAVSMAFSRMIENHTAWTIFFYRYVTNLEAFSRVFQMVGNKLVNARMCQGIKNNLIKKSWGHGIGRYTDDEKADLSRCDVTAISNFLGDKPYLFGDKMTYLDCLVFAHLCQVVLVDVPFPHKDVMKGKGQNLVQYIDRIKNLLWPDWDTLCDTKGKFE